MVTPETIWPVINTQGVAHAKLYFAIGGMFPLHTHPRASETLFGLKGSVYTGFTSDVNVMFAFTLKQDDHVILQHVLTANQNFEPNIRSAVIEFLSIQQTECKAAAKPE